MTKGADDRYWFAAGRQGRSVNKPRLAKSAHLGGVGILSGAFLQRRNGGSCAEVLDPWASRIGTARPRARYRRVRSGKRAFASVNAVTSGEPTRELAARGEQHVARGDC